MQQVVKVAKIGKSVESSDPNDFIFHSQYNTFKIIREATRDITLLASTTNQSFTEPHKIDLFIPLVSAFAKRSGSSQVFLPNGVDIETFSAGSGFDGDVKFNYISTDSTNIIFNFDNNKVTTVNVSIRYFVLEKV